MHRFKRLITAIFLTVFSIILLFSAAFAYLIVTPLGGKLLLDYFKQGFVSVGLMHVGRYEGSLQNGFVLKDVSIKGLSYMPDALLRVQEIKARLSLWDLTHPDLTIFNARILIPDSDPLVFTGRVNAGQIIGDLYGASVDLHAASRFWANEDIRKNLQGFVCNIDITIHGPLSSPKLSGNFLIDNVHYKSIFLTDGFSRLDLALLPSLYRLQIKGDLIIDSGIVNVKRTNLDLSQSKFIFQGNVFKPLMDIHLGGKVEDMEIHLTIKGPVDYPQMTVTSDPPMAPQEALQVLFTGNAWASSTSPFNGVTSSQLAENFLNYSLQDMNTQQQIGFKTKLTDNLKLGAEMDELPLPPGETNTYYSRKINAEMDMNDHMSLNVSREIFPQDDYSSLSDQDTQQAQTPETQVYLQYKKRF